MRFPAGAAGDSLRLQKLGAEFGLERYFLETDEQYEARLTNAFPAHEQSGTALGIVAQLNAYGLPDVQVVEDWQGTFADGYWPSRYWVVIGPDFGQFDFRRVVLGSTWTLGGPGTLGSTATREQIQAIVRIIQKWSDYSAKLVGVIVRWAGSSILGLDDGLGGPFTLGAGKALVWRVNNPLGSFSLGSWKLGTDILP